MKKFLVFVLVLILTLSLTACDNGNENPGSSINDTGSGTSNESASAGSQEPPPPPPPPPPDAGDSIVGTWVYTIDISSLLQQEVGDSLAMLGAEFADLFDDLGNNTMLTLLFEFNADGTFKMYADEDSVYTMVSAIVESLMQTVYIFMDTMLEVLAAEMSITVEDLVTAFEEEEGISFADYMESLAEEILDEMDDFDAIFEEFIDSGRYKIEGDRLFVASDGEEFEHYDVFEISGNTLTLLSTSDPDFDPDDFGGLITYPATLTRR